jgi:hypothetical protein
VSRPALQRSSERVWAEAPWLTDRRLAAGLLEVGLLFGLVAVALNGRLANLEHYSGSFDEGIRAQQLLLMELGYRPFRDIYASQGPLLLDLLYPLYRLFGSTLGAARLAVGVFSLAGLLGAWWALRPLHPLAGLGAAGLLAFSPLYLSGSRLALAEVPSLAPAIWAVGCALRWQRGGAAGWALAATLLAALSLLIKPMALAVLAPVGCLLLARRPLRLGLLLAAGLAALALVGLVVTALDAGRVLEVLGGYRLGAQGRAGADAAENLRLISQLLGPERLGLAALAGAGLVVGARCWPLATGTLLSWPLAQLGLFLLYTDLADKHVVYFLPPLALLAGLGLGGLGLSLTRARHIGRPADLVAAALGLAAVGLYLLTWPGLWRGGRELLQDGDERSRRDYQGTQDQVALMAALAGPTDFVLTDHPLAAFEARRPVPPWLVDTSGTRIEAGALSAETAIAEAERYRPVVVVTLRRRLGKLDRFRAWLDDRYALVQTYPGSDPATPLQVYVRADLEQRARQVLAGR